MNHKMLKLPLALLEVYKCDVLFQHKGWVTHAAGVDINNAPESWGQAQRIVLEPNDASYPTVNIDIPMGAKPYFKRRRDHVSRIEKINGVLTPIDGMNFLYSLDIRAGWHVEGVYVLKVVNMETKKVDDVHEGGQS